MEINVTQSALICLVVVLSLGGQTLMKKGMDHVGPITIRAFVKTPFLTAFQMISNPVVFLGVILAGIGAFVWLIVLSQTDLSLALPILGGLGYLLSPLISVLLLGEHVTLLQLAGTILIVVGIMMVSRG